MTARALPPQSAHRSAPAATYRFLLAALLLASAAAAQASEASCITAGRLNAEGRWAPRFEEVRLLDDAGRTLLARDKPALSLVRGVEITQPALMSACDGERGLSRGGDAAMTKAPVPAAPAGRYAVEAVGYARLQTGGELVELKVRVPADRVVMITR